MIKVINMPGTMGKERRKRFIKKVKSQKSKVTKMKFNLNFIVVVGL